MIEHTTGAFNIKPRHCTPPTNTSYFLEPKWVASKPNAQQFLQTIITNIDEEEDSGYESEWNIFTASESLETKFNSLSLFFQNILLWILLVSMSDYILLLGLFLVTITLIAWILSTFFYMFMTTKFNKLRMTMYGC